LKRSIKLDNKTGGSAFPVQSIYVEDEATNSRGMTLRDYFAAKAMQGLMSGRWKSDVHGIPYDAYRADADEWAKSAYHFADAMLKAREA
jgi:hypothetical protein